MEKLKPLYELGSPGQYFRVDVIGHGVYISFLPIRTRGSAKYQSPGPYFTYYPINNPRRLYEAFNNLRFGMLYKEIKELYEY